MHFHHEVSHFHRSRATGPSILDLCDRKENYPNVNFRKGNRVLMHKAAPSLKPTCHRWWFTEEPHLLLPFPPSSEQNLKQTALLFLGRYSMFVNIWASVDHALMFSDRNPTWHSRSSSNVFSSIRLFRFSVPHLLHDLSLPGTPFSSLKARKQ